MYAFRQPADAGTEVAVLPPPRQNVAATRYRKEESLNLSPVQVVCRLYDIAILSIKKNDKDLARRAINELIAALNFEYHETAIGLYRLYDYAKKMIRDNKNAEALVVMEELRSAWAEAFHLDKRLPEG